MSCSSLNYFQSSLQLFAGLEIATNTVAKANNFFNEKTATSSLFKTKNWFNKHDIAPS